MSDTKIEDFFRPEEVEDPFAIGRLAFFMFQDLYLTTSDEEPPMIRGLSPTPSPDLRGLIHVPEPLMGDTRSLRDEVLKTYDLNNHHPEFSINFDGITYRCSKIALEDGFLPNAASHVGVEHDRWHLRRLARTAPDLAGLGHPLWLTKELDILSEGRGLLLIAGTFSSGKTTTAAACLKRWIEKEREIAVTFEDPPEVPLDGQYDGGGACYQIHVTENEFAKGVKAARRWAPRYIYLGEIRTAETASELLQVSTGGPMTMATIHGSDPVSALMNLTKFAAPAIGEDLALQMLAAGIRGVLYQKIEKGRPNIRYLSVNHSDAFSIRSKIQRGRFDHIFEEVDTQERVRMKNNGRLDVTKNSASTR